MNLKYQCEHCGLIFNNPIGVAKHEVECLYNPKAKRCFSCAFYGGLNSCSSSIARGKYELSKKGNFQEFIAENGDCDYWMYRNSYKPLEKRIKKLQKDRKLIVDHNKETGDELVKDLDNDIKFLKKYLTKFTKKVLLPDVEPPSIDEYSCLVELKGVDCMKPKGCALKKFLVNYFGNIYYYFRSLGSVIKDVMYYFKGVIFNSYGSR